MYWRKAIPIARQYADQFPRTPDWDKYGDQDDIAEVWNTIRDVMDQKTGGELTCRGLDRLADEVLKRWGYP